MLALKHGTVMGLTYFRLLSCFYLPLAFMSGAFIEPYWYKVGVVLAILAALSDLEGYLARWWKCETEQGAWWDVFADKVACWTLSGIGWAICAQSRDFLPMLLIILAYDGIGWDLRRLQVLSTPSFAGKVKTFLLFPALIAMTWTPTGWFPELPSVDIAYWLMYAASVFAVVSMGGYLGLWNDLQDPRSFLADRLRAANMRIIFPALG